MKHITVKIENRDIADMQAIAESFNCQIKDGIYTGWYYIAYLNSLDLFDFGIAIGNLPEYINYEK